MWRVKVVAYASAAECDVAGFAVEAVVAKDEGPGGGESLGLVDGKRVPVVKATRVEIVGAHTYLALLDVDRDNSPFGVDVGDAAALAVRFSPRSYFGERSPCLPR